MVIKVGGPLPALASLPGAIPVQVGSGAKASHADPLFGYQQLPPAPFRAGNDVPDHDRRHKGHGGGRGKWLQRAAALIGFPWLCSDFRPIAGPGMIDSNL
jgi:hypothetical protein